MGVRFLRCIRLDGQSGESRLQPTLFRISNTSRMLECWCFGACFEVKLRRGVPHARILVRARCLCRVASTILTDRVPIFLHTVCRVGADVLGVTRTPVHPFTRTGHAFSTSRIRIIKHTCDATLTLQLLHGFGILHQCTG